MLWKIGSQSVAARHKSCIHRTKEHIISPGLEGRHMQKQVLIGMVLLFLAACSMPSPDAKQNNSTDFTPEISFEETTFPTQVPVESEAPRSTEAVRPTFDTQPTVLPNSTPTVISEQTQENPFPFQVQVGTPAGTANFVEPDAGCNWLGVGGQVFESNERPVKGMIVEVSGVLNGEPVLLLALTGSNTTLGPGGYQVKIADQPIESSNSLWIQLFDLNGNPKSDKVFFNTYGGEAGCDKNLIVINFTQVGSIERAYYFPVMYKNGR